MKSYYCVQTLKIFLENEIPSNKHQQSGAHFDQPCQEENHGGEVESGSPRWKTVHGLVHEDGPPFRGCGLVYREEAVGCVKGRHISPFHLESFRFSDAKHSDGHQNMNATYGGSSKSELAFHLPRILYSTSLLYFLDCLK